VSGLAGVCSHTQPGTPPVPPALLTFFAPGFAFSTVYAMPAVAHSASRCGTRLPFFESSKRTATAAGSRHSAVKRLAVRWVEFPLCTR
jgi:hypothetical protein